MNEQADTSSWNYALMGFTSSACTNRECWGHFSRDDNVGVGLRRAALLSANTRYSSLMDRHGPMLSPLLVVSCCYNAADGE